MKSRSGRHRPLRHTILGTVPVALLLAAGACADQRSGSVNATGCTLGILVAFRSDITHPEDPKVLASLVSEPLKLEYVRAVATMHLLRLTGPKPQSNCSQGIEVLRRDPRVLSLDLDERRRTEPQPPTSAP